MDFSALSWPYPKQRSGKTRKGSKWLNEALKDAAIAAISLPPARPGGHDDLSLIADPHVLDDRPLQQVLNILDDNAFAGGCDLHVPSE